MSTRELARMWTRDALAAHLESVVVPAALVGGQCLPSERSLSEQLGVSRALVREVLRTLEQRGLLDIVPGKGAYPREPGSVEIARALRDNVLASQVTPRQLLEARAVFELSVVDLAVLRHTDAELLSVRRALAGFDAANGIADRAGAAFAVHAVLARAAHNPVISTMFSSLSTLIFETVLRSLQSADSTERARRLYGSAHALLAARDGAAVGEVVATLVRLAQTAYGDDLDRPSTQQVDAVLRRAYGAAVSLEDVVMKALRDHALVTAGQGDLG